MAELKKYIEAIGRRKTANARVRISPASKVSVVVNDKPFDEYFPTKELQKIVLAPFEQTEETFSVTVVARGGGVAAQAVAVRHGISRALTEHDAELRTPLKKQKFLKRDPRVKERKKPGLKKARKRPQWSKR
ncbi:30S ribosomal protein S9 [Candidatus Kaiserbacteria bacterium CG10_big_fil_rev_8_21_14_0_10_45_20]|uniref:30S ribosomal protein S9 n=1 Tax=Candidatus Kaiserbacteria bacterium CG10_big_fil_rev_8_21_14_0_10_45_20 TaxID=1974607 RepID=A0A2H0UGL1_9BACT|nr:MAG: 30S ribosomal protein S9 [Candidatus Kaiserbacteria bacterium CG10_big_fil_rev_8_21_14_0_10_45_20]